MLTERGEKHYLKVLQFARIFAIVTISPFPSLCLPRSSSQSVLCSYAQKSMTGLEREKARKQVLCCQLLEPFKEPLCQMLGRPTSDRGIPSEGKTSRLSEGRIPPPDISRGPVRKTSHRYFNFGSWLSRCQRAKRAKECSEVIIWRQQEQGAGTTGLLEGRASRRWCSDLGGWNTAQSLLAVVRGPVADSGCWRTLGLRSKPTAAGGQIASPGQH